MERDAQRRIVEALIAGSPEPVSASQLARIVPEATPARIRELVAELNTHYEETGHALEVWEVAGGYQLRTRLALAPYLQALTPRRRVRLSQPALETLAVIAYRQPVTRAEVERIRGVEAGPVLRGLIDRGLVRIRGHREVPGRPLLYGTTDHFLEVFGLADLKDLPTLRDLRELAPPEEQGAGDSDDAPLETDCDAGDPPGPAPGSRELH